MNKALVLLCLLACIGSAFAVRSQWNQLKRAGSHKTHTVRFALTQFNVDVLEKTLLDISDPRSKNYGNWMTKEEVREMVAPSLEVSQKVAKFLKKAGATDVEDHRDMIKVTGTVKFLEKLLDTKLYNFQHKEKNVKIIRADGDYTIPAEIKEHVDFVSTLLEFPTIKSRPVEVDMDAGSWDPFIIPQTINQLYGIPGGLPSNPNSSLALIEFQDDQSYNKKDLQVFSTDMGIPQIVIDKVVGPYSGSSPDLESSLDVQYGAAIAQGVKIWFWTEKMWMYEFATDLINYDNPPLVASMSWGWPEPLQCQVDTTANCTKIKAQEYVTRTNVEFAKIGAMGISLFAASGDQGAPGDGNQYCDDKKEPLSTIFPGASPWVVSVGATMFDNTTTNATGTLPPICKKYACAAPGETELVCTTPHALITSGGGFSNYAPTPSYQQDAVTAYLKSGVALPPSKDFNSKNRGFPDVSALGHHYLVSYEGSYAAVDGTSCSSPVLAAIFSVLNSYRLNAGKKPLGFAAPLLYQAYAADPTTFVDITSGDNKCTENCCAKIGYEASKGWDPVTGLGTPQFAKLLAFVKSLP